MSFKKDLRTGKMLAKFENSVNILKVENTELKNKGKQYRLKIMNLNNQINKLKTSLG